MRAVPPSPATRLRALYFLYYGNVGTVLPFFAVYLHGLGFSGKQIGLVQMLPSFPLAPIVAVAWATWADHRATPQRALRRATGWVALAVLLLPFARTPAQVAAVVVLMALGDRAVPRQPRRLLCADPPLRLARVHRPHRPRRAAPHGARRAPGGPASPGDGRPVRLRVRARRARRPRHPAPRRAARASRDAHPAARSPALDPARPGRDPLGRLRPLPRLLRRPRPRSEAPGRRDERRDGDRSRRGDPGAARVPAAREAVPAPPPPRGLLRRVGGPLGAPRARDGPARGGRTPGAPRPHLRAILGERDAGARRRRPSAD